MSQNRLEMPVFSAARHGRSKTGTLPQGSGI